MAKPIRITARHVYETGGGRRAARRRGVVLKKPENINIRQFHADLSSNSIFRAQTMAEVDSSHGIRKKITDPLRAFESTKRLVKDRHHKEIHTKRAWQTLAAQERRIVRDHIRSMFMNRKIASVLVFLCVIDKELSI